MATNNINGKTYKWTDPATGEETAAGVGNPTLVETPSGVAPVVNNTIPDATPAAQDGGGWVDPALVTQLKTVLVNLRHLIMHKIREQHQVILAIQRLPLLQKIMKLI